jgi:hypothetical protein
VMLLAGNADALNLLLLVIRRNTTIFECFIFIIIIKYETAFLFGVSGRDVGWFGSCVMLIVAIIILLQQS